MKTESEGMGVCY